MNIFVRPAQARAKVAAALTGLALAGSVVTAGLPAAQAATQVAQPARSAQTAVDSTYLSDTLGLPSGTVVETVTYDRFQWLLQQPGQYAFLIGSTTDAGFAERAVAADAAARAAGVKKIYWFDPNLTGQSGVLNLDTRKPSGIDLAADSQKIFGNVWRNVVAQYFGNGVKATKAANGLSVTLAADAGLVNDAVDPLFDERPGAASVVGADDALFLVYDKDRVVAGAADKIVDWANLSDASDPRAEVASVVAASGGGAVVDEIDQFRWWKESTNSRHDLASPDDARYGGDIVTDAAAEKGWRVEQVTYPELLHLLEVKEASKNFVVLLGGTWCPNTRAVIDDINREAQENGVAKVYNFDLVLDGAITNGSNAAANPIHVRDNAHRNGVDDFRPSFVYGDLVRKYFRNLVTEYDPHTGNRVAYYPGNDQSAFPDVVRKLQVPFLVNYERGTAAAPSNTSIKRQWIQQGVDSSTGLATFKEYMTNAWFTKPSAQLGLNFAIPTDESTLTPAQQGQLAQARTSLEFGQEAVRALGDYFGGLPGAVRATRTVTADPITFGSAGKVTVAVTNKHGRIVSGQLSLSVAGRTLTAPVAENSATFTVPGLPAGSHPFTVSHAGDDQVLGFTEAGALTVRKARPGALSGKVVKASTTKKKGTYRVTVATRAGEAKASGKARVTLVKGKKKVKVTANLVAGTATVTLPKLAKGTWKVTLAALADSNRLAGAAKAKAITVTK